MTDAELIDQFEVLQPDMVALIRAIVKEEIQQSTIDRDAIEMAFRCLMQFARFLAKKYGFTIKQWPEN